MPTHVTNQPAAFLHNLLLFGRVLRGVGLDVSPGRMMDLASALAHTSLRRADLQNTARALLVHTKEDIALFDQAFEMFWQKPVDEWHEIALPSLSFRKNKPLVLPPILDSQPAQDPSNENEHDQQPPLIEITQTYSASEKLRNKDFSEMSADEVSAVKKLMQAFVWQLGLRRTRRKISGNSNTVDLRRTLRKNIKHGGEIVNFAWREPKFKPRPLVIIADISGSMEQYSRLLLHFVYAISAGLRQPVESFVFGTRLTRITRELHNKDIDQAVRNAGKATQDWGGGTRIGESLHTFNFKWGKRVLGHGAVVLLISDGWDRGEPKTLSDEMQRLHLNSHKLIWLNPLLGNAEYEPLTRGMQAALPHTDHFLPVHNLRSLESLATSLANLK